MTDIIDEIERLKASLQGNYQISFVVAKSRTVEIIGYLKKAGRDFLAATPDMENIATVALQKSIDRNFNPEKPQDTISTGLNDMGKEILKLVITRFKGNGKDVKLKPLKSSTKEHKAKSKPIGVDSGATLNDLQNAKVVITKI